MHNRVKLRCARPNVDVMRQAANKGFATATDLADHLVRKNIPFRDAHEAVGRVVAFAIEQNKNLDELTLEELRQFGSEAVDDSVFEILTLEGSVHARNHVGGTSPEQVRAAIDRAQERLKA